MPVCACLMLVLAQAPPPVLVIFETSLGAITIEVNVAKAPVTAANFLKYVDEDWYDDGRFHRTVRPDTETNTTHPIQVVQAGRKRGPGPGWPAVPLERTRDTELKHVDGAVSMARVGGRPDSAGSDFFVVIGDNPALDFGSPRNDDGQGFAVFGRVVSGMDVVKAIQASPVRPGTQSLDPPIRIVTASRKKQAAGGQAEAGISGVVVSLWHEGSTMKVRSLKLSKELEAELTACAGARGTSSSSVVREALAQYLSAVQGGSRRGPKSFAGLAADLAGCAEGPADLASNPKHLAGYGQPTPRRRR